MEKDPVGPGSLWSRYPAAGTGAHKGVSQWMFHDPVSEGAQMTDLSATAGTLGVTLTKTGQEVPFPLFPHSICLQEIFVAQAPNWQNWIGSQFTRELGECGLQSPLLGVAPNEDGRALVST